MSAHLLDTRGMMCPEPLREAELVFRNLPGGATVRVLATDPAASIDFEVWCLHKGHSYLGCETRESHLEIRLVKNPA